MATKKKKTEKFVVVRSHSAGVHCGVEVARRDSGGMMIVTLRGARRLWRWAGANSLNEVALRGVAEQYTRLSEPAEEFEVGDVSEIITCTPEARANLERSRWAP